jgi:hypothetical protein
MKRLNSLFCSSAYAVLEAGETGALHAGEDNDPAEATISLADDDAVARPPGRTA